MVIVEYVLIRGGFDMVFNDGDFVLIEYTIRVKETGNVVDTSDPELAKKENIYESERIYGPTLIVIGKKWVNEYVEEQLRNMSVGEERVIEVPPEKAYGDRDPARVKVFNLREFRKRGVDVRVGEVLDFGGVKGIVKSISGGRVVVDFNHPLAGKTLLYRVKVVEKIDNVVDKIRALASRHLGVSRDELEISYRVNDGVKEVEINIPSKYIAKRDIQYGKVSLTTDIFDLLKNDVDRVVYREVFERKKAEEKPAEATAETGSDKQ